MIDGIYLFIGKPQIKMEQIVQVFPSEARKIKQSPSFDSINYQTNSFV